MIEKNNNYSKKVLLIGPYPPPIGGVSIHIKRLVKFLLQKEFNDFILFDDSNYNKADIKTLPYIFTFSKLKFILMLLIKCNYRLIHYHSHNWIIRFLLVLIGKIHRAKICFTFHSFRDDVDKFGLFKKMIVKIVLNKCDHIIVVGKNEKNKLMKYGCKEEKITVIPAFINPSVEEHEGGSIPREVQDFISKHKIIITGNASGIRFFNQEDLYGIDMCIELLGNLKKKYKNDVGFVFLLPQIENDEYYQKLNARIRQLDITNNFLFVTKKTQMFPIIKKCSIFVRPTNSDGDAISIRESLFFNVPVIASDIVNRPEGTIMFKSRNQTDFNDKVTEVINNYLLYKKEVSKYKMKDYAADIFRLYNDLLK